MIGAMIYLLGFVGLASIGLIPLRSWQALGLALGRGSLRPNTVFVILISLLAAEAVLSDIKITARILTCLTESYCGPSVASGWTYLTMLGVVYVAFEVLIFVVKGIGRAKGVKPGV